jgi:transposase
MAFSSSLVCDGPELRRLAEDPSLGRKIKLRLKIVLLGERIQSVYQIAHTADTCVLTVRKWQGRYASLGLAGLLSDAPRPGRPRKIGAAARQEVLARAGTASTRTIARKLGLSRSTVHRILKDL